tara:strand:- start:1107 stop:1355 length:249 start_codon:yes stop_codon:yes gene_type:complete
MVNIKEKPLIDLTAPEPLKTINRSAAARALEINVSNVSRILSGQRVPHVVTLKKFADYLGVTLDELYSLLMLDKSDGAEQSV